MDPDQDRPALPTPAGRGHRGSDREHWSGPSAALPLAGAELDDLLRELLQRVGDVLTDQQRLRVLLDAVVSIAGELSLDSVLDRIVHTASELVGARYAGLGVLSVGEERRLQAFVAHGLSREEREAIGDLPRGRGLLGVIINQPEPLRLRNLAEHPESYGFPENHPPMTSFLGVPIRIRDKVFGNLYLTEKTGGGDFTSEDEAIVVALAAAAGVMIENAQLYQEAARRQRWLAATAEITGLLLGQASRELALQAVADRAREIAAADLSLVILRSDGGGLVVDVVSGSPGDSLRGRTLDVEHSLAATVMATGDSVVVEDTARSATADGALTPETGRTTDLPLEGPTVMVPLRTPDGVEGVLVLAWAPEHVDAFHEVDVELPRRFAEQAALALQVARARAAQERLSVFEDRDRIGRDLHDLVIQRLFAIRLILENTARMVERPDIAQRVEAAVDDIDATIKDIRRSIFALSAPSESPDIRVAIGEIVDRAGESMGSRPVLRFEGPVHSAVSATVAPHLLAVLGEALSNVVRHARASRVEVVLEAGDQVRLTVTDDGVGIAPDAVHSGLLNMRSRAERFGGRFTVEPADGGGTTVRWEIPGASDGR